MGEAFTKHRVGASIYQFFLPEALGYWGITQQWQGWWLTERMPGNGWSHAGCPTGASRKLQVKEHTSPFFPTTTAHFPKNITYYCFPPIALYPVGCFVPLFLSNPCFNRDKHNTDTHYQEISSVSIKTAGKKKRLCVIQQGRKLISVYQPALKGKFSMNKAERNCTKTVSPQLYGPKKRNATTEHTEHPFCSEPHSS